MKCLAVAVLLSGSLALHGATPEAVPDATIRHRSFGDQDMAAFREPAGEFRPETWFHFIGGNAAAQGITADLEAIAAAGIEGIQLFHGQFGGPWAGVEPQIKCLSPQWDGAVRHVAGECRRLGLRFTMQNCPGWAGPATLNGEMWRKMAPSDGG